MVTCLMSPAVDLAPHRPSTQENESVLAMAMGYAGRDRGEGADSAQNTAALQQSAMATFTMPIWSGDDDGFGDGGGTQLEGSLQRSSRHNASNPDDADVEEGTQQHIRPRSAFSKGIIYVMPACISEYLWFCPAQVIRKGRFWTC